MQWHGTLRACLGEAGGPGGPSTGPSTGPSVPSTGPVIIARDRSARGTKEYTVLRDARAALELVRATRESTGAAHFYEHMADAPCTLYFDIDAKVDRARRNEVLDANVEWIVVLLRELGHEVAREDMRVLDGTREGKVSFHVLVPRLVLLGDAHRAKMQAAIRRALERRPSDVDAAPYRRNALLRTPYSSKFGTSAPLLPVALNDDGAEYDDAEYMARSVRADAEPVFGTNNNTTTNTNSNTNIGAVEEIDDELAALIAAIPLERRRGGQTKPTRELQALGR